MSELPHQDALAALGPAVRALVACVLGVPPSHADVEDCTSEVYRRALEHGDRLLPGAPLRPWVLGIARHVALDARRARARDLKRRELPGVHREDGDRGEPPATFERVADRAPGPEARVELAQRTHELHKALAELPEPQRRALFLHAEGLGYREIAEQLAVPIGTICTWISRGRQGLARALKDLSPPGSR